MADAGDVPLEESETGALAVLAESVGVWDVTLEIRMGPDVPAQTTTGVATNRMLAGRWLLTDQVTESGFAGHGVYGWDAAADAYVAVWVDNAGGGMARGHGTWDPATRTVTYEMSVEVPDRTVTYREVTQSIDDDTRVYRNLMPLADGSGASGASGGELEVIKATYRRRPS